MLLALHRLGRIDRAPITGNRRRPDHCAIVLYVDDLPAPQPTPSILPQRSCEYLRARDVLRCKATVIPD